MTKRQNATHGSQHELFSGWDANCPRGLLAIFSCPQKTEPTKRQFVHGFPFIWIRYFVRQKKTFRSAPLVTVIHQNRPSLCSRS
jgi:hypothetical protein